MVETTMTEGAASRSVPLDVLRGVAILLVLGAHEVEGARPPGGRARLLAEAWQNVGWTGVDLFFVLSGFLVGGLIFAEVRRHGSFDWWRFVRRRWFRTLPLYLAFLALLYARLKFRHGLLPPLQYLRSNLWALLPWLTFTQNYRREWEADQSWSLAVEEHFYLLLPAIVVGLLAWRGRAGLRAVTWIAGALIAACLAMRLQNLGMPFGISTHHQATHLRIDSLFLGVAIAYLYHFRRDVLERIAAHRTALVVVALALLCPFAGMRLRESPFAWTVGYILVAVSGGLLVIVAAIPPAGWRPGRLSRTVAAIGFYSYGIYIWHQHLAREPLEWLAARGALAGVHPTPRWAAFVAVYVGTSLAAAWVSYRWIEAPALRWRDRVVPSRARSAVQVADPIETPGFRNLNGLLVAGMAAEPGNEAASVTA